jgi:pyrimidine deaminase RibD-like protein
MFLRELLNETLTRTGHGSTAVVGWGRGMGHKGHMYLASAVIHKAQEVGGDPYFVVSRTVGKDDPINPEEKMAIYKKVFPDSSHIFQTATDEMPDLTRVLSNLNQQGYTNAIVVVGADQVKALAYVKNYNNTPDKTGKVHYKFDNLEVISRQETSAPDAQEEGPRATPMRQVLMDPAATEEQKFAVWRDAMNPEIDDTQVMDLMHKAEQRMKAIPAKKVKEGVFMQKMKNNFGMDQSAYDTKNPGTSPDYVDSNITVQLLKNIDRHGGYPIQFKDGTELHVSSSLSQKILFKIQDLLPKERHAVINHIIQSSTNFKSFAQGLSESMMPKKNFAGADKNKLGPAAHLKGKMKRAAKAGDLVGAMEAFDSGSPVGGKRGSGEPHAGYDMDAMRKATGTMEDTDDFEVHGYHHLDELLAELCRMVVEGHKQDPERNGLVAAGIKTKLYPFMARVGYMGKHGHVHAERAVLEAFTSKHGEVPEGSIMLVTLSPCNRHDDKTASERVGEPCSELVAAHGIEKVYCGLIDPSQAHGGHDHRHYTLIETENSKIRDLCEQFANTFLHGKERLYESTSFTGALRNQLNRWMDKDQKFKDPSQRIQFQEEIWPQIEKYLVYILEDRGPKGDGDYPSSAFAAWLLVQHMDAFPNRQREFLNALEQYIPNHPKIQFLRDRLAVNEWVLEHYREKKYYYKGEPLPDPTVNIRNPAYFKDASIKSETRSEALSNAEKYDNVLLVAAVNATGAETQPSYTQQSESISEVAKVRLSKDPNDTGAYVRDIGQAEKTVDVPISKITVFEPDEKFDDPRYAKKLKNIIDAIRSGKTLPPILLRRYGVDRYQVLDGHHRFKAYRKLGKKTIPARIVDAKNISGDIDESLDSSYRFKYEGMDGEDTYIYSFMPENGSMINVSIYNEEKTGMAHVVFYRANDDSEEMTGEHPTTAAKVLGTVKAIIRQHLQKFKNIKTVKFEASKKDLGRVRAYNAIVKRLGGKADLDYHKKYAAYEIPTKVAAVAEGIQIPTHRTKANLSTENGKLLPKGSEMRRAGSKLYVHIVKGKPKDLYNIEKHLVDPIETSEDAAGVGIVTKQNSTADVGPGTIRKNLKAFKL